MAEMPFAVRMVSGAVRVTVSSVNDGVRTEDVGSVISKSVTVVVVKQV